MSHKVLVIEDEEAIVRAIRGCLESEGFQVVAAYGGFQGIRAATDEKPDLLILDLILPESDGLEVCRKLRRTPETSHLPILMLSGKGEEVDKVVGLQIGADDYMTKPFSAKELVARVQALLRRSLDAQESKVLKAGDLEIDPERYTVSVGGKAVALTAREFELLKALLEAKGRALSRDYLLETVWGLDRAVNIETRTVDVHIRSLRSKLSPEGRRILTVRNVGYRCDVSPEGPAQNLALE